MIIYIALYLTLAILSKFYPIFIIISLLISLGLISFKKFNNIKIPLLIYLIYLLIPYNKINTYEEKYIEGEFIVYEAKANYCLVKNSQYKFIIYDHFNFLDVISLKGKVYDLNGFSLDNRVSSFRDYLYNKGINRSIYIDSVHYTFKSPLRPFIKHSYESKTILDYVLFNNKNIDDKLYNALKSCLLLPMFVVSGLHINLIYDFLSKHLKKKYVFMLILVYLFYLNFQLPALRAFLMLLFCFINEKYELNVKKFDIFIFVYVLILMVNPMNLFNISFLLTFLCSFFLFFIKGSKLMTSFLLNLGILPLIIYLNKEFNLLGIFASLFFSLGFKYFYFLSFIVYMVPLLDPIYVFIFKIFTDLLYSINIFNLNFIIGNMSIAIIIVYYFFYFLILLKNSINLKPIKEVIVIASILVTISFRVPLFNYQFVSILDIGQGSCALIVNNNNITLIDTGGSLFEDLAVTRVIPYLKSYGIKKIDNIIISHNDFDHNGALQSLKTNFRVKNIYDSYKYKEFYLNDLYIKNLNFNIDYDGEDNLDSGVMYFNFIGYNFLIMGDAPISVEKEIIANYKLSVDYLVVGHHGSKTSSDYTFLKTINPSLAIISCGLHNKYGHPHKIVLDNLNNLHIPYKRTDLDGTIVIAKDNICKKVIS